MLDLEKYVFSAAAARLCEREAQAVKRDYERVLLLVGSLWHEVQTVEWRSGKLVEELWIQQIINYHEALLAG